MCRLAVLIAAMALAATPAAAALKAKTIARLSGLAGKPVGTVTFIAVNRGALVTFDLHDLPPRPHAIHLHTSANCDTKTGLTSAGPILTLTPGKQHGFLGEGGADEHLHASTIGSGKHSIFDKDGVGIILDAREDTYCTQPLDNAGDQIACGVVIRTRGSAK